MANIKTLALKLNLVVKMVKDYLTRILIIKEEAVNKYL